MEKSRRTFDLEEIKKAFSNVTSLRMSVTAITSMASLDLTKNDVVRVVQSISNMDFHKSMTSYSDHRIWQDVYHVRHINLVLYVKFTIDEEGYFLISFKEK